MRDVGLRAWLPKRWLQDQERAAAASLVNLTVVDPALKEVGGHHAGFADKLITQDSNRFGSLTLLAHKKIEPTHQHELSRTGARVQAHFTGNYYRGIGEDVSAQERLDYVNVLASEFVSAWQLPAQKQQDETSTTAATSCMLYPSFGWEHLLALATALYRYPLAASNWTHVVCLMFKPSAASKEQLSFVKRRLGLDEKLLNLRRSPNVRLFCSDFDLEQTYRRLLSRSKPLALHPYFNAPLASPLSHHKGESNSGVTRIMLYAGDAKLDKGFDLVPGLAEQLLQLPKVELVVQYTNNWGNKEVASTIQALERLAMSNRSLNLYAEYWADQKFNEELQQADLFVFTHRARVYQQQSSGLLWLVGAHNVPAMILEASWLSREAERLHLPLVTPVDPLQLSATDLAAVAKLDRLKIAREQQTNAYHRMVYQPFHDWLVSLMSVER